MADQPLTGKYKFKEITILNSSTVYGSNGLPVSSILYRFNIGDVIDVQKIVDKGGQWQAVISEIKEEEVTVPFSTLEKVDDATPITTGIIRRLQDFTTGAYATGVTGATGNNGTGGNNGSSNGGKSGFFTTKNIIIGIVLIAVIFGILKWAKVF